MPATMMHVYAGYLFYPQGDDSFFMGCILPDCVDGNRTLKDHLHFRDVPPESRLQELIRFGKRLDLSRPFHLGALLHFYLDYLWDNGPQKAHRMRYEGEDWFHDYRKELARAGSETAHRFPWAKPLWERLSNAPRNTMENDLSLPEEDMLSFLDYNCRWHTEEVLPKAVEFHADLVDSFTRRAVTAYHAFLRDFFPEVTLPFTKP